MAGEEIQIGPFVSGLDTASDPTAIPDTALSKVVNFELSDDGSLTNRPPITTISAAIPGSGGNFSLEILGIYNDGTVFRIIASNSVNGTYTWDGTTWTLIASTAFAAGVQYQDKFWLIAPPVSSIAINKGGGGYWTPSTGFVADNNMPHGNNIFHHKDRLWITRGKNSYHSQTRLYTSDFDGNNNLVWNSTPDSIGIGTGDGQAIVTARVNNSDIIIFKEKSTWRYTYSTDPGAGSVTKISDSIGLENKYCVEEFENTVYTVFQNRIYSFVNFNYAPLNSRVPLKFDNPNPINLAYAQSLSIWADRLIVTQHERTYVYKIRTRTWCEYESKLTGLSRIGKFYNDPNSRSDQQSAFVTSPTRGGSASGRMWYITDAVLDSAAEDMTCYFETKNYDYQSPTKFKRLFWWGADVLAKQNKMTFMLKPTNPVDIVTWGMVGLKKWKELGKWGSLLDDNVFDIIDIVEPNVANLNTTGRRLVKIPRGIRFRQVKFRVEIDTDGSTFSAPVNLFSLATHVTVKQTVSKKAS